MAFGWLRNVVRTAGRGLHSAGHAISKTTGAVSGAISKVPIVGHGLHGLFDLTVAGPWEIAGSILSGERLDHVAIDTIKRQVQDIQEVGPYAEMVLANVPGVGSGVAAAIGAGIALSEGRPITQAFADGLKDSIPGGAVGQALYSVSHAALTGESLQNIAISALPIPASQQKALEEGLKVTLEIARGEKFSKIVLDEAKAHMQDALHGLPPGVQKAVGVGIAVGHAQSMQHTVRQQAPSIIPKLIEAGEIVAKRNKIIAAGADVVPDGKRGYYAGIGLMQYETHQTGIVAVRQQFSKDDLKGFDLALSLHIGMVTMRAPIGLSPAASVGYYTTMGMRGAEPGQKTGMMRSLIASPGTRHGANIAVQYVIAVRATFWERVKELFGYKVSTSTKKA